MTVRLYRCDIMFLQCSTIFFQKTNCPFPHCLWLDSHSHSSSALWCTFSWNFPGFHGFHGSSHHCSIQWQSQSVTWVERQRLRATSGSISYSDNIHHKIYNRKNDDPFTARTH